MSRISLPLPSDPIPTFEDSRIQNHPDEILKSRIRAYFKAFTTSSFDDMNNLYSEDYTMTDIPIAAVRAPKKTWYEMNQGFSNMLQDLKVTAISLYGSSAPGQFAILEHLVEFTLKTDPPEQAKPNLPPGAKKGDKSGMINIAVLWWNEEGKICKELEYGRLIWDNFDLAPFDKKVSSYSL